MRARYYIAININGDARLYKKQPEQMDPGYIAVPIDVEIDDVWFKRMAPAVKLRIEGYSILPTVEVPGHNRYLVVNPETPAIDAQGVSDP